MSRIGKQPITLPSGVSVSLSGQVVEVKGKNGTLKRTVHESIGVEQKDGKIVIAPRAEGVSNFFGLTRTLINNMVIGVSAGYSKELTLIGVGYRAAVQGESLNLTLGYSHPVVYKIPKGIKITVDKQTSVKVEGADKEQVGQVAADIRGFRKPEPYHGKGVRYADEKIITKVGKASGKK